MNESYIKCKDTLKRYYDITGQICTVATLIDPRFWLGYISVRYDKDPNKNEKLGDILRFARQIYVHQAVHKCTG